jgi:hypothetical protein
MSFTLNLGFGGLCLMVHDEASGEMYVLLPPCNHADLHIPKLVYDTAAPRGEQRTGIPVLRDIADAVIDLSAVSQTPPVGAPPVEVANLETFGARVPRNLLVTTTGGIVSSRIKFAGGTSAVVPCGEGDNWLYSGTTPERLPIRVVWSMQVAGDFIDVEINGINGIPIKETVRLFPFPVGGTLDVWVFNSPEDQLPLELPPRTSPDQPLPPAEAEHFKCFYTLTNATGPAPKYHSRATPPSCFPPVGEPGLDVMCIAARALPQ